MNNGWKYRQPFSDTAPADDKALYNKIYEWEYVDKDGKVRYAKKDVYKMIQSAEPNSDYKTAFNNGLVPSDEDCFYGDVTSLGLSFEEVTRHLQEASKNVVPPSAPKVDNGNDKMPEQSTPADTEPAKTEIKEGK